MFFGVVRGTVVCTNKSKNFDGVKLYVIDETDENGKVLRKNLVAADTVGARTGDLVMWVDQREATFAMPNPDNACDAAIIGIIDSIG
jgi:microcompartment protein CcmK/EutM